MSRVILILALILSAPVLAGSWQAGSMLGDPSGVSYWLRSRCEAVHSERCYDVSGKPISEYSIQSVQVDDTSKPLYGPKLKVSGGHEDLATCQTALPGHCDDQSPGYEVRAVCAEEDDPSTNFELYCIARFAQSYEQMTVDRYLPDSTKQSAKAAEQAALQQVQSDVKDAAMACYIQHRNGTVAAGDVIPCQKALYDFVREILQQLN